jgi:hypothetical protein
MRHIKFLNSFKIINLSNTLAMRVKLEKALPISGMILPLESPRDLSSGGINARVSESIPHKDGIVCAQEGALSVRCKSEPWYTTAM